MKSAVCVLIPNPENRAIFLAISRRNDTTRWGLPGGKVDPGETNLEATVRELSEEIGVNLVPELFEPIFSDVCQGNGPDDTYWVTTYLWKGGFRDLDDCLPEQGMELKWACASFLTSPRSSPFARYNQGVFNALQKHQGVQALNQQAEKVAEDVPG